MKKYNEFNNINEDKKQDIYSKYKDGLESSIEKLGLSSNFEIIKGTDVSNKKIKGIEFISFNFNFKIQGEWPVGAISLEDFEAFKRDIIKFVEQFDPYKDEIKISHSSYLSFVFYILPENIENSDFAKSAAGINKFDL